MNEFDKLELSTETIRELTADEMREVAGGAAAQQSILPTCQCTGYYPSINAPCVSRVVCTD
jgi:natural product precursor